MRRLLWALPFLLVGCASYIDYGEGRYGVTKVSEERSAFGTNGGFMVMYNCKGTKGNLGLEFDDCNPVTHLTPIYSQGVGGQIVGGALTGLGFGLGSAFSGVSNSASSISNATASTVTKGGHK